MATVWRTIDGIPMRARLARIAEAWLNGCGDPDTIFIPWTIACSKYAAEAGASLNAPNALDRTVNGDLDAETLYSLRYDFKRCR